MLSRTVLAALSACALAACATPYQESGFRGGVSAQRITSDTFMVTAQGNGYTSAATITQYTLRKAAEATLAAGNEWFVLVGSQDASRTGAIVIPGSATSSTTAQATYGGGFINGTAQTTTSYTPAQAIPYIKPGMVATFRMGRGPMPAEAMRASEVSDFLTPKTVRQADLDAWVGVSVASLDGHPLFRAMQMQRIPKPDGGEVRDYVNGNGAGTCHNRFTVRDGKVERYEPRSEGAAKCFTDDSVRPRAPLSTGLGTDETPNVRNGSKAVPSGEGDRMSAVRHDPNFCFWRIPDHPTWRARVIW